MIIARFALKADLLARAGNRIAMNAMRDALAEIYKKIDQALSDEKLVVSDFVEGVSPPPRGPLWVTGGDEFAHGVRITSERSMVIVRSDIAETYHLVIVTQEENADGHLEIVVNRTWSPEALREFILRPAAKPSASPES
jgi:hypothetical protein